MVLTKEAFNKIADDFPTLLLVEEDRAEALYFAAALLEAEADATRQKFPYATRSIDDLESALHTVYELARDADSDEFSEEG